MKSPKNDGSEELYNYTDIEEPILNRKEPCLSRIKRIVISSLDSRGYRIHDSVSEFAINGSFLLSVNLCKHIF